MGVKENFAANLIKYRKAMGLTQAELAEIINYSDKAVSKWERAESCPDLETVKVIADFFGVSIDSLIAEVTEEKPKLPAGTNKRRTIVYLLATGAVWLIAICCYVFLDIIFPQIRHFWPNWLALVYAVPVSAVVLYIFTSVYKSKILSTIFTSLFVWSTITAAYLSLFHLLPAPPARLWEIFLIGVPLQVLIVCYYFYGLFKRREKKRK